MLLRPSRAIFQLSCALFFVATLPGRMATAQSSRLPSQAPIPVAPKPYAEEGAVIERILNRVRFENNGTDVSETEAVVRIQSQAGVAEFGQLVFGYSPSTEKLEIEYVRVRKPDGQVINTPTSYAQDFAPDVLRQAPMYTDYRQRHISVAALQPGDVLEYRTVTRVETPLAAGNFWYEYTFPRGVVVENDRLEVNVPINRQLKLKSPTRKPEVQDVAERRTYIWDVRDLKSDDVASDDKPGAEEDRTHPDIQLSTFTDWKQIAQWYAKLQGDQMTVNDDLRKHAEDITKGAATPEEKTRRLYDFVARNIRYVSISLGVGRYQPHPPLEVLNNGYGDCKDKHTLFAAMMKAEGIQSYPVLIDSSRQLDPDVPSPAQFDHVITAVRIGDKLTWLDTTPEVAPFGMILYQLRNKEAVLASDDNEAGLQRTPADSPVADFLRFNIEGGFNESGALDAWVELSAQGDRDWPLRRTFRQMSGAQWKPYVKSLSESWGLPGDIEDVSLDSLEDTGKPFHLKYRLYREHYFQVPSSDVNFMPMPAMGISPGREIVPETSQRSEERLANIDIGPAGEISYRARLHFTSNYTVRAPTAIKISRDFGAYSFAYSVENGLIEGERKLVVNSNEVPAARRTDYDSFKNVVQNDLAGTLECTIVAPSSHAESSSEHFEGTSTESQDAGVKALQEKNYPVAIQLLKRANELDPKLKDGMYDLGLAYAGAADHVRAIAAFRQQLKSEPNHKRANGDLAFELQQNGNSDEAVAAYRLQLKVAPYDKLTHRDLGLLLAKLQRYAEAREELEIAAASPPDDPEARLILADVYEHLGESAKAQPLLQELTGSSTSKQGENIYETALRDDVDPGQSEREAQQVLYEIGAQFDAGELDRIGPASLSTMRLVALSWARIGWARFRRDENLSAMQFLNAAWLLSTSPAIADRLGRVYEKQGQLAKAERSYALAVALSAGNSDAKARLDRLENDAAKSDQEISRAHEDLASGLAISIAGLKLKTGAARFNLVFDGSPQPVRAEFSGGDEALRSAESDLRQKQFPVKFPDASSIRIIRQILLHCTSSGCTADLLPLEQ